MPRQPIVLLFALFGAVSCALADVRRGRSSLLAAGLSAGCLAALAFRTGSPVGTVACSVVLLASLVAVVAAGPWLDAAPLGPLAALAAMGLYLRGTTALGGTGELLVLVGAAVAALCLADREPDDGQVGATTLGLGLLALGLASGTGRIPFWRWGFDPAALALPALAAGVAGFFSSRGGERRDLAAALAVAVALLASSGSLAELLLLFFVTAVLYVLNAPRRTRAALGALGATLALVLLALTMFPDRIIDWLEAPSDVYGAGFDLSVLSDVLRGARPLGDGVPDVATLATPDFSTLYTLGQAVSAFGWAGLALPALVVASVIAAFLRALPSLGPAERNLALALLATFAASAAGNALYVFHLAPVPAIPFPLLSSSASATISFVLAGVELSRVVGSGACREVQGAAA